MCTSQPRYIHYVIASNAVHNGTVSYVNWRNIRRHDMRVQIAHILSTEVPYAASKRRAQRRSTPVAVVYSQIFNPNIILQMGKMLPPNWIPKLGWSIFRGFFPTKTSLQTVTCPPLFFKGGRRKTTQILGLPLLWTLSFLSSSGYISLIYGSGPPTSRQKPQWRSR